MPRMVKDPWQSAKALPCYTPAWLGFQQAQGALTWFSTCCTLSSLELGLVNLGTKLWDPVVSSQSWLFLAEL